MPSFLCIYIFWFATFAGSLSADPTIAVSVQGGSTAVLPCNQSDGTYQTYVQWLIEDKYVFERTGNMALPGEGYAGRVDIPLEELLKGNFSLILKNVSVADLGIYTCNHLRSSGQSKIIQQVELSLKEPTEERSDESSGSTGE